MSDLADRLATHVFEQGDEDRPGGRVQRLQYKGGKYPDCETDLGGLCQEALAGIIRDFLHHEPILPKP